MKKKTQRFAVLVWHRGDAPDKTAVMFTGSKWDCMLWMRDAIFFNSIASAKELKKDKKCLRWNTKYVSYYIEPVPANVPNPEA